MEKIKLVKTIGSVIVSLGVTAIVNNVVKSTTPATVKVVNKLYIAVGGFVLASMVSKKVSTHFEEGFDKLFSSLTEDTKEEPRELKLV